MKLIISFLFAITLFAGQSVQWGAQAIYNITIPTTPTNRLEAGNVCWTTNATMHVIAGVGGAYGLGATGWSAYFQSGSPMTMAISNAWDNGAGLTLQNTASASLCVSLRLQHDPTGVLGAPKNDYIEAWDPSTGVRLIGQALPYTTETASGIGIQSGNTSESTASMGFLRISTTLLPLNSTPPTTYTNDPNRVMEWKFDCTGGLGGCPSGWSDDATGNGYTAIFTSGNPTLINTLYQSPPFSVIRANSTTYTNVTTVRAGAAAPLNGTSSYSQSDTSATVTCSWREISGPSQVYWQGTQSSCTPTPIGLVWGDYVFNLIVTDINGVTGSSQVDVGSVAQDSKGIVVNADPNVDAVFGSMIAYGRNPWGFADQWEYNSMFLRCSVYGLSTGCVSPSVSPTSFAGLQWEQTGAGTVSYVWGGVGNATPGQACNNTLTGNITATQATIPISNSACVNTGVLPTRILLGTGSPEEIRICSVTAGTPPAETLNVCYDGRGYLSTAASASSGTNIQQFKVTGIGTNFITDSNSAVCPIGFPSPTGSSYYSTGSVTLVAGSATVVGSGTTFTSGMVGSYFVVLVASHSSTSYTFIRQITGFTNATHITLASAYPSDSDSGVYFYSITAGQRTLVLQGPMAIDTAATGLWMWNASGCESATTLYINPFTSGNEFASGHAAGFNTGTTYSSLPYSVTDTSGWIANTSQGGINFYGESGAWRKLWLRSGLTAAGNAANLIDNHLVHSPWGNLYGGGCFELICGGPGIMGFASAILGAGAGPGTGQGASWGDLRSYAAAGESNINGIYNSGSPQCWQQDTRSNSYAGEWLVLGALYDPNSTWRTRWQNDIATMELVDTACAGSDSSFTNTSSWSTGGGQAFGPVTLTNNLRTITGALALNSGGANPCVGTGYGTGNVTNGSGAFTIATTIAGSMSGADAIAITGTMGGQPLSIEVMIDGSLNLAALWPGDTGTVTWMGLNTSNTLNNQIAFGVDNSDANLIQNYMCYSTNGSSGVLDHAWTGNSGSAYYGSLYVLSGNVQQAFYNGINAARERLLANSSLPQASYYQSLLTNTVAWIKNTGFNNAGLYVYYGNIDSFCAAGNALVTNPAATTLSVITPGCSFAVNTANPGSVANNRAQNSELGIATSAYYAQNPAAPNKTWGDQVYGAVWGNPQYNIGGVYYDQYSSALSSNIGATNLYITSQAGDKWPGFYCGVGSCDEWPAYRLGGPDPVVTSDIYQPFTLSGITGATKVKITVTAASGLVTSNEFTTSPARLTNIRQHTGWALMRIDYENSGGTVIALGVPLPLYIP